MDWITIIFNIRFSILNHSEYLYVLNFSPILSKYNMHDYSLVLICNSNGNSVVSQKPANLVLRCFQNRILYYT